jgi:HD-GYP domain-containing protein (c-di-GMP phosphodiesterase class II)
MVKNLLEGVEHEHFVQTAYHIARYHHERWDGKGYPEGLVGETIPLEARIMAVADVYDALVSERVYKKALPKEEALRIMKEGRGTQFDPDVLDAFLEVVE